jgi:hypothetical protein
VRADLTRLHAAPRSAILRRMDEVRFIRGRKVTFERPDLVEHLRYSLDVFDERDNLIEVLGRVADLAVAHAAFDAAVAMYPDKRICIRDRARVIRKSDGDQR